MKKSSQTATELDLFAQDESAWGSRGRDDILEIDAGWQNWQPTKVGLVSTNSIVQGEQVGVLWGWMLEQGMRITFAHRTFAWANEGKGNAAVHCVIIGFGAEDVPTKRLYAYPDIKGEPIETFPANINPYLIDAPSAVVTSRRVPIQSDTPRMDFGSMPNDGGYLSSLSAEDVEEIRTSDPTAAQYLRPLVGSKELINGIERYCLWLAEASPADIRKSPVLAARVDGVRKTRLASTRNTTRKLAQRPSEFGEIRQPKTTYLAVPSISSGAREYVPVALLEPEVISNNKLLLIPDATLAIFGVLASRVFSAWNETVSGRLKSDFQIGVQTTYNNFPMPVLDDAQVKKVEEAAQHVIDARATHPGATLADLYDPLAMPANLRSAHDALDSLLLRAIGLKSSATELEVLSVLMTQYATLTTQP